MDPVPTAVDVRVRARVVGLVIDDERRESVTEILAILLHLGFEQLQVSNQLAQVVRLQEANSHTELDLINQALEQREVLPRLRTAAADIISADD